MSKDYIISATGHTWENAKETKAGASTLVSEATCTEDAVYNKVCSVCDAIGEDEWTDEGSVKSHSGVCVIFRQRKLR